ncbi:MAG: DUF192 domain-containing protein [Bacteriovoracaceae bacterium]
MKVNVSFNGKRFIDNVVFADNFWLRLTGYMFRQTPHVPGILFSPCNSIQTTFMRFPLDLAFLDNNNRVVKIKRNMKPWRMTPLYFKATKTLELPVGILPAEVKEGDVLEVTNV